MNLRRVLERFRVFGSSWARPESAGSLILWRMDGEWRTSSRILAHDAAERTTGSARCGRLTQARVPQYGGEASARPKTAQGGLDDRRDATTVPRHPTGLTLQRHRRDSPESPPDRTTPAAILMLRQLRAGPRNLHVLVSLHDHVSAST